MLLGFGEGRRGHEGQFDGTASGGEGELGVARGPRVAPGDCGSHLLAAGLGGSEVAARVAVDVAAAALHEHRHAVAAVVLLDPALGVAGPVAADEEVVAAHRHGVGRMAKEPRQGLPGHVVHVKDIGVRRGQAGFVDAEDDCVAADLAAVDATEDIHTGCARLGGDGFGPGFGGEIG